MRFASFFVIVAVAYSTELPIHFEPNLGQSPAEVRFLSSTPRTWALLDDTGVHFTASGLRLRWSNTTGIRRWSPGSALPGRSHYYSARTNTTNVQHYAGVRGFSLYPGVDIHFHGTEDRLEFDFELAAGADPSRIAWTISEPASIDRKTGDLVMHSSDSRLMRPLAWQFVEGRKVDIPVRYRLKGREIAFALGRYDRRLPLVIDPLFAVNERYIYVGGTGTNRVESIVTNAEGQVHVVGTSNTPDVAAGVANPKNSAFVTKLYSDGTVMYTTYLDGSAEDTGKSIAFDSTGAVYVAGTTASANFPVRTPFQSTLGGGTDAFAAKLSPSGEVVWASYAGGPADEAGTGVAVNASGVAYFSGETSRQGFPTTTGAYQSSAPVASGPNADKFNRAAFIVRVSASSGAREAATVFGPVFYAGSNLLLDSGGNPFFAGMGPTDMQFTSPAVTRVDNAVTTMFAAKLNPTLTSLVSSVFILDEPSYSHSPRTMTTDSLGNLYFAGRRSFDGYNVFYRTGPHGQSRQDLSPGSTGAPGVPVLLPDPDGSRYWIGGYVSPGGVKEVGSAGEVRWQEALSEVTAMAISGDRFWVAFPTNVRGSTLRNCVVTATPPASLEIPAAGGSMTFQISARQCPWVATSDATIYPVLGEDSGPLTYTWGPNLGIDAKSHHVSVSNSGRPLTSDTPFQLFTMSQPGLCGLTIGTPPPAPAAGGVLRVPVTIDAGCSWTPSLRAYSAFADYSAWVGFLNTPKTPFESGGQLKSGARRQGSGTVDLDFLPNNSTFARKIFLFAGSSVEVVQPPMTACSPVLTASSVLLPAGGAINGVPLNFANASCDPPASTTSPWIRLLTSADYVGYMVETNTSPVPRSGTIVVGTQVFTINQAGSGGCTFTVSPTPTDNKVTITASAPGCAWSAFSSLYWARPEPSSGVGSGTVSVVRAPSFGSVPQEGSISVAGSSVYLSPNWNHDPWNKRAIQSMYYTLLRRNATAAEVEVHTAGLADPRGAVASIIQSQEFRISGRLVAGLYVGLLNRDAEFRGWSYQTDALIRGFVSAHSLVNNFLNSPEYISRWGSPSDAEFVRLLYRYVLGREASPAEVTFQSGAVASVGRTQIALNFLLSEEYFVRVGTRLAVTLLPFAARAGDATAFQRFGLTRQLNADFANGVSEKEAFRTAMTSLAIDGGFTVWE